MRDLAGHPRADRSGEIGHQHQRDAVREQRPQQLVGAARRNQARAGLLRAASEREHLVAEEASGEHAVGGEEPRAAHRRDVAVAVLRQDADAVTGQVHAREDDRAARSERGIERVAPEQGCVRGDPRPPDEAAVQRADDELLTCERDRVLLALRACDGERDAPDRPSPRRRPQPARPAGRARQPAHERVGNASVQPFAGEEPRAMRPDVERVSPAHLEPRRRRGGHGRLLSGSDHRNPTYLSSSRSGNGVQGSTPSPVLRRIPTPGM